MFSSNFFTLFLIGFIILIFGVFLLLYSLSNNNRKKQVQQQKSKVSLSGIVMIGPIPIIFGCSKWFYMIPIVIIAAIFMLLLLGLR
jgi:uncharacterized protein (TIGR00304 family)